MQPVELLLGTGQGSAMFEAGQFMSCLLSVEFGVKTGVLREDLLQVVEVHLVGRMDGLKRVFFEVHTHKLYGVEVYSKIKRYPDLVDAVLRPGDPEHQRCLVPNEVFGTGHDFEPVATELLEYCVGNREDAAGVSVGQAVVASSLR